MTRELSFLETLIPVNHLHPHVANNMLCRRAESYHGGHSGPTENVTCEVPVVFADRSGDEVTRIR